MGITVAGYGLSAFVYATISGYIVGDNTAAFLLILAIGTSASFAFSASVFTSDRMGPYTAVPTDEADDRVQDRTSNEMNDMSPQRGPAIVRDEELAMSDPKRAMRKMSPDTGGLMLFKKVDYWLIMIITFAATGTGLMWINNVGTVVGERNFPTCVAALTDSLHSHPCQIQRHSRQLYTPTIASDIVIVLVQVCFPFQVTAPIADLRYASDSCLGRLFIGAASDSASSRYGIRPVWWLVCLCLSFIASQFIARSSAELGRLSIATSVTGFAYGEFYGLAPIILL